MNETVKAALLAERERAATSAAYHLREIRTLNRQLGSHEAEHIRHAKRVAELEAALTDGGVDLAAMDAEAEKARPVVNLGGQHSLVGQQQMANLGIGRLNVNQQNDIMTGLARALDQA